MSLMERIESHFLYRGRRVCDDCDGVALPVLEHALQTAQLAERDQASLAMVAAALLHDIGRLLPLPPGADPVDDAHELRAVSFLAEGFGSDVLEPIRLHVQAKRYLAARDPQRVNRLPAAAARKLARVGGPLTLAEIGLFEESPFAADAVHLCLYDDHARVPGLRTPRLEHYMALIAALGTPSDARRLAIA